MLDQQLEWRHGHVREQVVPAKALAKQRQLPGVSRVTLGWPAYSSRRTMQRQQTVGHGGEKERTQTPLKVAHCLPPQAPTKALTLLSQNIHTLVVRFP